MGNPAGVRRDFAALEQRRMHAARLLEKGYSQSEVARRVGAHRQSVSQWAAELAIRRAPPMPWSTRAAMRSAAFGASAAKTDTMNEIITAICWNEA